MARGRNRGSINQAALAKLKSEIAAAEAKGHHVSDLVQVLVSKTQYGWATKCSCGWQSNAKKRKLASLVIAMGHVEEVNAGLVPIYTGTVDHRLAEGLPEASPESGNHGVSLLELAASGE